jgi:hypothetical protein
VIGAITAGLYGTGVPPVTNSYESIATVSLGSTQAYIDFTSIVGTYKHLQIRAMGAFTSGGGSCDVEFNSDTTGTNYYQHALFGSGTSAGAGSGNNKALGFQLDSAAVGGGVMDLLDYSNTNKYKTTRTLSGNDTNGGGYIVLRSGLWKNTAAITSIRIIPASGSGLFTSGSHFALYGIKG